MKLKAIHTYVQAREGFEFNRYVAHNMLLSVLYAQMQYDGIELYTDEKTAKIVKEIGIPYNKIITKPFDNFESNTFSIPKLVTYSLQKEPYVHLDVDTFVIKDIYTPETIKFFYAHPDITMEDKDDFQYGLNMYNTYLKNTYQIQDEIPDFLKKHITFKDIPNMNIFGTRSPDVVAKAAKLCLEIYEKNREFFDSEFYNACIIEQLLMPAAIKYYNEEHYENFYLQKPEDVFRIKHGKDDNNKCTYPLEITFSGERLLISVEPFLYQFVNYDYRSIVHLGGYKNMDVIQFLVKETIMERFGCWDKIKNIIKVFDEKMPADDISDRYYVHMLSSITTRIKEFKSSLI